MIKRVSSLKEGDIAVITGFENDQFELKLMEMGCVPGEKIIVEKVAPLGDPVSILISGYKLSLRMDEANSVIVDTID